MSLVIEFLNQLVVRVICKSALLAFSKHGAERLKLGFRGFKQPQSSSNNFTGGAIAPIFNSLGNKLIKVSIQG